jgi:hypothetical protein
VAIAAGIRAGLVPGAPAGAHALVFYKVTCSVTRLAGPPLARLGDAFPGAVLGVGQDPQPELDRFAAELGWGFPQVPDLAPYRWSDAYGIVSAPTLVVVDGDGAVADVAESWDRDAMNRAAARLASLRAIEPVELSTPGDGLPDFKPG